MFKYRQKNKRGGEQADLSRPKRSADRRIQGSTDPRTPNRTKSRGVWGVAIPREKGIRGSPEAPRTGLPRTETSRMAGVQQEPRVPKPVGDKSPGQPSLIAYRPT